MERHTTQDRPVSITEEMARAGADCLFDFAPDCLNYEAAAREVYAAMERARTRESQEESEKADW